MFITSNNTGNNGMSVGFSKTVTIDITEDQLKYITETLNRDIDEDDGEKLLTVQEVRDNKQLLEYIFCEAINDGIMGMFADPEEFWNNDGWCDWQEYRN